ncbi:MAG TPA: hypothetical protein DDY37_01015, partial [Legionella sp.]|nr:hypothetical protein [Legionella sp.]
MAVLYALFKPLWETNDDVAMSMMAHGYGIAAFSSPLILFSNVLWGHLIRAIPELNGVLGYSTATVGVLTIVGFTLMYGLLRLGIAYISSALLVILVLLRPTLFPQFTMNAGLLMVGALVCWHVYARKEDWRALFTGCFLAFCSYLVRSQEFFLMFAVALPLLPWRALLSRPMARIALLCLALAIALAAVMDHQAYQGSEWGTYKALNPARLPFTDYGAGTFLKQHNDILDRHGYSDNDIDLIKGWFFVDPVIANPTALNQMLTELGPLPTQAGSLTNGWEGTHILWQPRLFTLVLTALLLMLMMPNRRILASWGLFWVAIFCLGLLGRPGIFRVCEPVVYMLLVAPFLIGYRCFFQNLISGCVLVLAVLIQSGHVISDYRMFQHCYKKARADLAPMAHSRDFPMVVWGGGFPYQAIYPVLNTSTSERAYQLYCLGWPTWAPNTVSYAEHHAGRGLKARLMDKEGIPIMASAESMDLLNTYCRERLHGQMKE